MHLTQHCVPLLARTATIVDLLHLLRGSPHLVDGATERPRLLATSGRPHGYDVVAVLGKVGLRPHDGTGLLPIAPGPVVALGLLIPLVEPVDDLAALARYASEEPARHRDRRDHRVDAIALPRLQRLCADEISCPAHRGIGDVGGQLADAAGVAAVHMLELRRRDPKDPTDLDGRLPGAARELVTRHPAGHRL